MKRFFYKVFILFLGVVSIAFILDWGFTQTFKDGKTNKVQWLKNMNNKHYDYVVLGTSRAWWNLDIQRINEASNLNGISIANNHFSCTEMLLRMKRFLNNKNTTDKVYLQIDYFFFKTEKKLFSPTVYNFIPYLNDSATYHFLSEKSDEWIWYKYAPFIRYTEFNFQWGLEEVLLTKMGLRNTIFDEYGAFFSNNRWYGDSVKTNNDYAKENNHALIELLQFCDKNKIDVELYTAPFYNLRISTDKKLDFYHRINSLEKKYTDFSDLFQQQQFFNDNEHLSIKGGKAFTDTLIVRLFR